MRFGRAEQRNAPVSVEEDELVDMGSHVVSAAGRERRERRDRRDRRRRSPSAGLTHTVCQQTVTHPSHVPLTSVPMADPEPAAEASGESPATGSGPVSATATKRHVAKAVSSQQSEKFPLSPGHGGGGAENIIVRRNSKDKLDNIAGFGDGQRRSSSSSSIRSRRCSGDSIRQIAQLASIKETINSNRSSQDELESLIQAKLSQCRVIFDFLEDPLSDLKYKVSLPKRRSHCSHRLVTYSGG